MKKRNTIIIAVISILVLCTIGYALFSETVNVKGTAKGEGNLSMIFSKVGIITESGSVGTKANIKDSGKTLEIKVPSLEYPGSHVEVKATVKNDGTIKSYLKAIKVTGLDNNDIKVSYNGVKEYDIFNPTDEKEINIRIEWDKDSKIPNGTLEFSIGLDFEQLVNGKGNIEVFTGLYAVGEELCLNGKEDCFNVIKDNGDSVTMLAKNVLSRDGLTQIISTNEDTYRVAFAEKKQNKKPDSYYGYWTDDAGNILSEYGNAYPVNVYNSNSNTYKIVEAYVSKLKGIKGITDETSLIGRLIYSDEYTNLNNIQVNRTWLYNGQAWWTGSAESYGTVLYVDLQGNLKNNYGFWNVSYGARPVITISKSAL